MWSPLFGRRGEEQRTPEQSARTLQTRHSTVVLRNSSNLNSSVEYH